MSVTIEGVASASTRHGHDWCLLCGARNPWSLRLSFQDEDGGVTASFQPHRGLQGYEGILHGGVISALLDSAMTHCLFHHGVRAVTVDLRVRFLQPVHCRGVLDLRARIVSAKSPIYRLRAELGTDGRILAWAEAKFMEQRASQARAER